MKPEELQALLTAFSTMADSGREMFLWWLAYKALDLLTILLIFLAAIAAFVYCVKWVNPQKGPEYSDLALAHMAVRSLWLKVPAGSKQATDFYNMYQALDKAVEAEDKAK